MVFQILMQEKEFRRFKSHKPLSPAYLFHRDTKSRYSHQEVADLPDLRGLDQFTDEASGGDKPESEARVLEPSVFRHEIRIHYWLSESKVVNTQEYNTRECSVTNDIGSQMRPAYLAAFIN